jgi:hypothetical protein
MPAAVSIVSSSLTTPPDYSFSSPCKPSFNGRAVRQIRDNNPGTEETWKKAFYIFLIFVSTVVTVLSFAANIWVGAIVALPTAFIWKALITLLQPKQLLLSESEAMQNATFQKIVTASRLLNIQRIDAKTEKDLENLNPNHPIAWGRLEEDGRLYFLLNYTLITKVENASNPKETTSGLACCIMEEARVDSPWTFSQSTPDSFKEYCKSFYNNKNTSPDKYLTRLSNSAMIEMTLLESLQPTPGCMFVNPVDNRRHYLIIDEPKTKEKK